MCVLKGYVIVGSCGRVLKRLGYNMERNEMGDKVEVVGERVVKVICERWMCCEG